MTTRTKLHAHTDAASWEPAKPELRLMTKGEMLERVGMSYPTLWSKMRAGTFPRSVVIGGRVAWYAHEIDEWLHQLPRQRLKGEE
jgi:prophage regulatory protein